MLNLSHLKDLWLLSDLKGNSDETMEGIVIKIRQIFSL